MLGERIRELREKRGLSLIDLSCRAGLEMQLLEQIESGEVQTLDNSTLMAISDNLGITLASDFIHLLNLNRHPRKFKCYRIGLLQTGSNAMRLMFSRNYKEALEFMFGESIDIIAKYYRNDISREDVRCFALKRDCLGHLEFDSAFFLHYFIDILTEHFKMARVIFNIRDCYSWVNCMVNFVVNQRRENNDKNWSTFMVGLQECFIRDKQDMINHLPHFIDQMLVFWANENQRILKMLPDGRSLIIKTHEIYRKVDEVARFLNIPVETLDRDMALTFPKVVNHNILHEFDYNFLNARFNEHCSELMTQFYPDYTLGDFLEGNYLTDIQIFREQQ